jgi:hypothetical protein
MGPGPGLYTITLSPAAAGGSVTISACSGGRDGSGMGGSGYLFMPRVNGDSCVVPERHARELAHRTIPGGPASSMAKQSRAGDDGIAVFDLIRRWRNGGSAFLYAFDLLELNGDDLRREPVCEDAMRRKRDDQRFKNGHKTCQNEYRRFPHVFDYPGVNPGHHRRRNVGLTNP